MNDTERLDWLEENLGEFFRTGDRGDVLLGRTEFRHNGMFKLVKDDGAQGLWWKRIPLREAIDAGAAPKEPQKPIVVVDLTLEES